MSLLEASDIPSACHFLNSPEQDKEERLLEQKKLKEDWKAKEKIRGH